MGTSSAWVPKFLFRYTRCLRLLSNTRVSVVSKHLHSKCSKSLSQAFSVHGLVYYHNHSSICKLLNTAASQFNYSVATHEGIRCNVYHCPSIMCSTRLVAVLIWLSISGLCCLEPYGCRCIICKAVSSHGNKQILRANKGSPVQQTYCTCPSCKCPISPPTIMQSAKHCCRHNSSTPAWHKPHFLLLARHTNLSMDPLYPSSTTGAKLQGRSQATLGLTTPKTAVRTKQRRQLIQHC